MVLTWASAGDGIELFGLDGTGTSVLPDLEVPPSICFDSEAVFDQRNDRVVLLNCPHAKTPYELVFDNELNWRMIHASGQTPANVGWSENLVERGAEQKISLIAVGGCDGLWTYQMHDSSWVLLEPTEPCVGSDVPFAFNGHPAIYDPALETLWLVASDRNEIWTTSPHAFGWTRQVVEGTVFPQRQYPKAIFDPVGRRFVMFGGIVAGEFVNDVWVFPIDGPLEWTELNPKGKLPPPREHFSLTYDPIRHRMILHGGEDANSFFDDVWALTLDADPTWSELNPVGPGPTPRSGSPTVYDSIRDRLIVVGGWDGATTTNDVWALEFDPSGSIPNVQVVSSEANLSRSAIDWSAPDNPGLMAMVMRTQSGVEPVFLGDVVADAQGQISFQDSSVSRGEVYSYGLLTSGFTVGSVLLRVPLASEVTSVTSTQVDTARAAITWDLSDNPNLGCTVQRRLDFGSWNSLADVTTDALGSVSHDDSTVVPGSTYFYRLFVGPEPAGEVMIEVPSLPSAPVILQAEANLSRSLLLWSAPHLPDEIGFLNRRRSGELLTVIDQATSDSQGNWTFSDSTVIRGETYLYSLEVAGSPSSAETPLSIPLAADVASVVSAEADIRRTRIVWNLGNNPVLPVDVQRQRGAFPWVNIATTSSNSSGVVAYDDSTVVAGENYSYRLAIGSEFVAAVHVAVPASAPLSLSGAVPNPAVGQFQIAFSLSGTGDAVMEVFDLRGRLRASRNVTSLGPGSHVVTIQPEPGINSGIYIVRLTQDESAISQKMTFIR